MTRTNFSIIAFAFATLFAGSAMAANADTSPTREQVKAELAKAVASGNIVVDENGDRLNQIKPQEYPAQQATPTVTRAQVQADLATAIRTGNIIAGESGQRLNQLFPQNYHSQQAGASMAR